MPITNSTGVLFGDTTAGSPFAEMMRELYSPAVIKQIVDPNAVRNLIKTVGPSEIDPMFQGKAVTFAARIGHAIGGNAQRAGGKLPTPTTETYDRYSVPIRTYRRRILVDPISGEASESRVASWLNVVTAEADGAMQAAERDLNRQACGNGSGKLAEVNDTATSATHDVRLDQYIEGVGSIETAKFNPTKFFKVGQPVAIIAPQDDTATADDPANDNLKVSTSVSSITDLDTVVFADSFTGVVGDWIVEASETGLTTGGAPVSADIAATAARAEMMGLNGILMDSHTNFAHYETGAGNSPTLVTDGQSLFQGADATATRNQASVFDNGGTLTPLTRELLLSTRMRIQERSNTSPDLMVMCYGMYSTFLALIMPQQYYVQSGTGPMATDIGFGTLTFDGMRAMFDRDFRTNAIGFLRTPGLFRLVLNNLSWWEGDGAMFSRLQDREKLQALLRGDENIGCTWRREHGILVDLSQAH